LEHQREQLAAPGMHEVAENCCEMLLAWAQAVVESSLLPGKPIAQQKPSARQALALLDKAHALAQAHRLATPQAYHLACARYHALAGEEKQARHHSTQANKMKPHTALDHFLSALEYFRHKRFDLGAHACVLALTEQPHHFWAQYLQALCYVNIGNWAAARDGLNTCLGMRKEEFCALLLRGTVHAELGTLHNGRKEREAAQESFAAAAADFARALAQARNPLEKYLTLNNRSVLWVRQQRFNDAENDLRAAIALRPNDPLAYSSAAEVCRRCGDLPGAVAALDRAVAVRPNDGLLYSRRAFDYRKLDQPEAAARDFQRSIRLLAAAGDVEHLAAALVELGVLKDRAGELSAALCNFEAALAVRPNHPPANRQRAETLLKLGRPQEAGRALDYYLFHGKPDARVYLARGLIHLRLKEYQAAADSFSRSLLLQEDSDAFAQRGWARLQLDAPALALADFEASLKLRPKHASTLCGKGQALALLGRVSEAISAGEEALHLQQGGESELLVAVVYARAASLLALTQRKRGRERPETRFEERAADLLALALRSIPDGQRAGWWQQRIQTQPALAAIRRHPKLVRMVAGWGNPVR
jgi:tetratricopeptide (TPR) repeat protein